MLWQLFFTFFKIGLFTFGGGYAMIANIREVVVDRFGWLDEDELMQIVTVAESTPGPIAINLATYMGYKKKGFLGSLLSTLGVVLPSLVIIYVISLFLEEFMTNRIVAHAFVGIKCAVAFLILRAGLDMMKKLPRKPVPVITFLAVFAAALVTEALSVSLSSILYILMGGAVGIAWYSLFGKDGGAGKEGGK